jgi:hypothetical protein
VSSVTFVPSVFQTYFGAIRTKYAAIIAKIKFGIQTATIEGMEPLFAKVLLNCWKRM